MKVMTTPKGKAVWPRLKEPDTKFDAEGMYSVKLHVSEEDFKAFEATLQPKLDAAYKAECDRLGKSQLRMSSTSPLRITDEGEYEIYAKQKAKVETRSKKTLEFSIGAVDSQGKKIEMPNVGSGSILKLAVEPSTWFVPSQGFGYSLRLKAVQIIDLCEFGESGDQGDFGFSCEEDGYVGSGEKLDEAIEDEDEAEETTSAPF